MILIDNEPDSKGVYRVLSDQDGIYGMAELERFLQKAKVKVLKVNKRGDAVAVRGSDAAKLRSSGTTWRGRAEIDEILKGRQQRWRK